MEKEKIKKLKKIKTQKSKFNKNKKENSFLVTENILKELENNFLLNRKHLDDLSSKEWQDMFEIIVNYTESLVKKFYLKNKLYLSPEKVREYAIDSTILLMKKYKEKKDFRINFSFGGFLKWKIVEVIYNTKNRQADQEYSLNYILEKNNKKNELLDNITYEEDVIDSSRKKDLKFDVSKKKFICILKDFRLSDLVSIVDNLLKEYSTELLKKNKYRLVLLGYLGILLYLKKPQRKFSFTNFLEKQNLSIEEKNVLECLLFELKKRFEEYFF